LVVVVVVVVPLGVGGLNAHAFLQQISQTQNHFTKNHQHQKRRAFRQAAAAVLPRALRVVDDAAAAPQGGQTQQRRAVFTIDDGAALKGHVGFAALGESKVGVDPKIVAEALARESVFSHLAITGPPGAQYLVAQPDAFHGAVDKADQRQAPPASSRSCATSGPLPACRASRPTFRAATGA
jgi:hypothetical protein